VNKVSAEKLALRRWGRGLLTLFRAVDPLDNSRPVGDTLNLATSEAIAIVSFVRCAPFV